jgi:hypothetical protein
MSDWRENEDKNLTEHRIIGGAGIYLCYNIQPNDHG